MRSKLALLAIALTGVFVASCSDSPVVAEVNGDAITAAQVDALSAETPEEPAIAGQPFRDALGLLIVNAAMRTTAEDQFGATGPFARGAAENFAIRDAVVAELATGDETDDQELDALFFAWRAEAVEAADVWVRSQVGEWGGLSAGVLPPP